MSTLDLDAHRADVLELRAARDRKLRSPTGWLALVDRIPLVEGDNALPIGTLVVSPGGQVAPRLRPAPRVTRAGQPVAEELAVEVAGARDATPDVFELDGRSYEVFGRGAQLAVRVRDPEAPARRAFRGVPCFPIDPVYRIVAALAPLDPPRRDPVAMTDGSEGTAACIGTASFELGGGRHVLAVYAEDSTGRLFVPFGDASSGDESYGGGRMLYVARPAPGGPLVIDFNLAFNPPCALNPLVTCPLPPRHNRLSIAVRAGERRPDAEPGSDRGDARGDA